MCVKQRNLEPGRHPTCWRKGCVYHPLSIHTGLMVIINIPRSHIVLVVLFWNKNINVCYLRTPFSLTKDSVRRTHLQLQLQISTSRYESKKRGIVGGCASWFLRLNYKCKKKKTNVNFMQSRTLKWCHGCWSHRYTYSGMYLFAYHTLMLSTKKTKNHKHKKKNPHVFVEIKTSINADKNKHSFHHILFRALHQAQSRGSRWFPPDFAVIFLQLTLKKKSF